MNLSSMEKSLWVIINNHNFISVQLTEAKMSEVFAFSLFVYF